MARALSSGPSRISAWLAEASGGLTSIFLPAGCRLSEQLLTTASRLPICGDCLASFPRISGCICQTCGLPLDIPSNNQREREDSGQPQFHCESCHEDTYHFDRARSFAKYEDSLVRAIVLSGNSRKWTRWPIGSRIGWWRWYCKAALELQTDVVVPVPLHKDRYRERGFNQAELLSKRLANRLRLPFQGVLLFRKRPRPGKLLLTNRERWESVRGAFATRSGSQVDNKRVLLVDDVMTAGATLYRCAKALREAGACTVGRVNGWPRHSEPAKGQPLRLH